MNRVETTRDMVWQSFTKHLEEIENLENDLGKILAKAQAVRIKIEEKKAFLKGITTLSFDDVKAVLSGKVVQNRDGAEGNNPAKPTLIIEGIRDNGTRLWVLKAIAYYEDHNPESHINEKSIRIYINANFPGFLEGHRDNIIHCALGDLRDKGFVARVQKSQHSRQAQYALTPHGRKAITTETEGEVNHG